MVKLIMKFFIISLYILFFTLPVNADAKNASTSIPKSVPASPASNIKVDHPKITPKQQITPINQIPLSIQDIALKDNMIHVTIAASKSLTSADYKDVLIHVTAPGHFAGEKWTLQKADKTRSLCSSSKSLVFNTKIEISSPGLVTATLSKGKWKSIKRKSLIPTKKMVVKQKAKKKTEKPDMVVRGKVPEVKSGTDTPVVPMISTDTNRRPASGKNYNVREHAQAAAQESGDIYRDMGIDIMLPIQGHNFDVQRDIINVRYKALGQMVEDGKPITFRLMRGGLIVDTKTRTLPYYSTEKTMVGGGQAITPIVDNFEWRIPATAPTTEYYYIHAIQEETGAVGFGHYFEVSSSLTPVGTLRGEVNIPIDIIEPVADDTVIWGETRPIAWTMPEEDESVDCGNQVTLYAQKEGTDQRIRLVTVNTEPGRNTWDWPVSPENVDAGRYQIEIESSQGCKIRGAAFDIQSCDFAVDSAAFDGPFDGIPLSRGIDASDGSRISGTFKVKLRWNKIQFPSTFVLGTDYDKIVRVKSVLTGNNIGGSASIDYSTAFGHGVAPDGHTRVSYIYVEIPFNIDRDNIAHMMTGSRNIPLEFFIDGWGPLRDTDSGNDRLEADMKVLSAKIVDLQIMFWSDEFSAPRDSHTPSGATTYQYYFNQSIRVRNTAPDELMGGPADDLLNVPVAWYIEYRVAGDSSWHTANSGRSVCPVVSADFREPSPVVEGSFTTPIGSDRTYRLRMVIDPDHEYMDSDRSNNEFSNTLSGY